MKQADNDNRKQPSTGVMVGVHQQPDPTVARMVSDAAALIEEYGDDFFEMSDR